MTVAQIIAEIKSRAHDSGLGDDLLLTRVNNEYHQTNLAIINLNEDYFFTTATLAITTSLGPYELPADFGKFRALIAPSEEFIDQASPADENKPFGWFFSGTRLSSGVVNKRLSFTDDPRETGNYTLRYAAFPGELDLTTNTTPLWPNPFHEILILGGLKRTYSVQDLYSKFPDLSADLSDLRATLLAQVGGLNLGAAREVASDDSWK